MSNSSKFDLIMTLSNVSWLDLLYCSWWQHSANLASYEQQDAHEFFISLLDGIHEKENKLRDTNKGIVALCTHA